MLLNTINMCSLTIRHQVSQSLRTTIF